MRNSAKKKEKVDAFPFTFRGSLRRHFTSTLVPLHMILLEITWWWVCHRMKERIWQIFSSSSFSLVALSYEFLRPAKTNEGFTGQGGIAPADWCWFYVWQLSINKSVYFQSRVTRFSSIQEVLMLHARYPDLLNPSRFSPNALPVDCARLPVLLHEVLIL